MGSEENFIECPDYHLVIACSPALAQQTAKDQAVVPGVKSFINFQVNGQGYEVMR